MGPLKRATLGTAAAAIWLFAFGFVVFAAYVMRAPAAKTPEAEGIVVLTGGQMRIVEGARLLREQRAGRMLISGVNPQTPREDVQRLSGLDKATFNCCVDLDYVASDTVGNAVQASKWARTRGYSSLIVVTSAYHMPRSLAEFGRMLPSTRLVAHPVLSATVRSKPWWLDVAVTRNMVSEYLKFLPAAAKLALARISQPFESSSMAEVPAEKPPKI